MEIVFLILIFPLVVYSLLILQAHFNWKKIPSEENTEETTLIPVTVLIPARNEEKNIGDCLKAVFSQDYPPELFEVIVIDDHSTDTTSIIVQKFQESYSNLKLIRLNVSKPVFSYKKKAIEIGISEASGEIIITTDADTISRKSWLSTLICFYSRYKPKMLIAPVCIFPSDRLFSKWQSLEFSALIGFSGAAAFAGFPVMCNGANLLYEKKSFSEVDGFSGNEQKASGDDIFLMEKFKQKFGSKSIHFIKHSDALVSTRAVEGYKEFFYQRKRWTSKTTANKDGFSLIISSFVLLTCISLLLSLVFSFFSDKFAILFTALFGLKCLVDFIFLKSISSFFKTEKLLWMVVPGQFINIFYVPFIAISSLTGGFYWKDRKLS